MADAERWVSDRARSIQMSGVRKIFELARHVRDPIDLSIGQPHFPVPAPIQAAARAAIAADRNGYTLTQGIPELRQKLSERVAAEYPGAPRGLLVTSGTSGGLLLAMAATIDPGDEVIGFDPYFVGYPAFVRFVGGRFVALDTYPDFQPDPDRVEAAITPRTKAILVTTPSNPTGVVPEPRRLRDLAAVADRHGLLLISDEIYRSFSYDAPHLSPAAFHPDALVIEGFGKTYGFTGWRLGYAHGPAALIEQMTKLQQFSYVCAPSVVQHAGLAALDFDVAPIIADYRRKRDRLVAALTGRYEFVRPGGAFYLFPRVPWGNGTGFAAAAARERLLIIPGGTFSSADSHFRISYAARDDVIDRGAELLLRLLDRPDMMTG